MSSHSIIVPNAKPLFKGIFYDTIALFATGSLNHDELYAIDVALDGLIKTRMFTKDICPDIQINMFFVFEDEIQFAFNFSSSRGICSRFAFLPVHKWRKDNYGTAQMTMAILEEACHLLMNITDEDFVKTKVLEVMYRAKPEDMKNGLNPYTEWPSILPFYMRE